MLTLMYFEPVSKHYIAIDKQMIPIILNQSNESIIKLAYINYSNKIISNVTISATIPSGITVSSYVSDQAKLPSTVTFSSNINHSYTTNNSLKQILPGGTIFLFIKTTSSGSVKIDFTKFTLDISYTESLIALSNLAALFELTETAGTTTLASSYPTGLSATASSSNIIRGNGKAYFRKTSDIITFSAGTTTELTLFMKVLINDISVTGTLFESTDFSVNINTDRKLVIEVDSDTTTLDYVLNSTEREYSIVVAVASGVLNVMIDGNIIDAVYPSASAFVTGPSYIIGGNIDCDVSSIALYKKYYSPTQQFKL